VTYFAVRYSEPFSPVPAAEPISQATLLELAIVLLFGLMWAGIVAFVRARGSREANR